MGLDFDRFDQMRAEGRLLRGQWTGTDAEGRETACWLAALSAQVATAKVPSACPAEDLPQWLAHLVPVLDDRISLGGWGDRAQRFGAALHLTVGWSPQQWRRREARVMLTILTEARSHVAADYGHALAAIDGVIVLWPRVAAGDEPGSAEWAKATAEADAAVAKAAARAVASPSRAAASSWAAVRAAQRAVAWAAADAAEWAAGAAARAVEAFSSAAAAARAAAWDRICDGVIAALEGE